MASIFKPAGRTIYNVKYRDQHGAQRKGSTGLTDKRLAEALRDKIEGDVERLRSGQEPKHPDVTGPFLGLPVADNRKSWDEAVATYLNELARNGSGPNSDHYKDSKTLLARIQRETGWQRLIDIRSDEFTAFLGHLAAAGRAPRTQNRYFETLRAACRFWSRQGWRRPSPLEEEKPVKVGEKGHRQLRRPYTLEELDRLCAATRWEGHRVAYRVAAFSGLRWGELRRLTREDCTPTGERPRWHVPGTKTKNGRPIRLPMTGDCAEALRAWWEQLPPGAKLLKVPRKKTWPLHRAKAGIPAQDERGRWADFHSLRLTFCTLMSKRYPIEIVAKFMRHGSLNLTTSIYLDLGLDTEGEGAWETPRLTEPKENDRAQGQTL